MALTKIEQKTIRQRVYESLKQNIIQGDPFPGQNLSLRTIAEDLGVSLMPVREALWQLESEGIIIIESNRSIHVNELSPEGIEEVLRIRLLIETQAAERSCYRRPESCLLGIERILESMEVAAKAKSKRYLAKNNEFHFALYAYADSPILLQIIKGLWARIGPYIHIHLSKLRDLHVAKENHRKMYQAFVEQDPQKLTLALRADLEYTAENLTHIIRDDASPGNKDA